MLNNLPDFDELAPSRDQQFCSVGFVCRLLSILPAQMAVLMKDEGLRFSRVLDGVGYLTISDAEKCASKCAEIRAEIASVADSVANN